MSTTEIVLIIALFLIVFMQLYNKYVKKKGVSDQPGIKPDKSFHDVKEDDYEPYSGAKS